MQIERDAFYAMLGIAMRAGQLSLGESGVLKTVSSGTALFMILDADASDNTKKKFRDSCAFYKVPLYETSPDRLGQAIGKPGRMSAAIARGTLGEKLLAHLDNLQPARTCPMTDKEREIAREWFLLTTKPVIYACNIKEDDLGKDEDSLPGVADVKAIAAGENAKVLVISAKIEEDIAQMDDEEKDMFLEEMGIGKSGLDRLIAECYDLLGLISFLTAGADECRAWTIRKGTKAPQAAGKIHSDFERGFIRAEIVSFDDLKANGSMTACKEKGLVRSEGKDYVMQDGDVTLFRFNV